MSFERVKADFYDLLNYGVLWMVVILKLRVQQVSTATAWLASVFTKIEGENHTGCSTGGAKRAKQKQT
jgi:hypothetical protein